MSRKGWTRTRTVKGSLLASNGRRRVYTRKLPSGAVLVAGTPAPWNGTPMVEMVDPSGAGTVVSDHLELGAGTCSRHTVCRRTREGWQTLPYSEATQRCICVEIALPFAFTHL